MAAESDNRWFPPAATYTIHGRINDDTSTDGVLAVIYDIKGAKIREPDLPDGAYFLTDKNAPLQIGYLCRSEGHTVQPHAHIDHERKVVGTPEVLIIISGKWLLTVYEADGEFVDERCLENGMIALLMKGGHSVKCVEAGEILEVKQGPYMGMNDKRFITPTAR